MSQCKFILFIQNFFSQFLNREQLILHSNWIEHTRNRIKNANSQPHHHGHWARKLLTFDKKTLTLGLIWGQFVHQSANEFHRRAHSDAFTRPRFSSFAGIRRKLHTIPDRPSRWVSFLDSICPFWHDWLDQIIALITINTWNCIRCLCSIKPPFTSLLYSLEYDLILSSAIPTHLLGSETPMIKSMLTDPPSFIYRVRWLTEAEQFGNVLQGGSNWAEKLDAR